MSNTGYNVKQYYLDSSIGRAPVSKTGCEGSKPSRGAIYRKTVYTKTV